MAIETSLILKLREETGVGMMDAKSALEATDGDYQKAVDHLKKLGKQVALKKQDRSTKEGIVGSYIHANGKVAALVALACETDFVEKTDNFQTLAHDLAMHVAAADPQYLAPTDVPASVVDHERDIFREQLKREGKPAAMIEKIITGKLKKFYSECCFLQQPFIKDDSVTIEELIQQQVLKLGENIQIKEFKRIAL